MRQSPVDVIPKSGFVHYSTDTDNHAQGTHKSAGFWWQVWQNTVFFFLWKLRDYIQQHQLITFSAQGQWIIRLGQRSSAGQRWPRLIHAEWRIWSNRSHTCIKNTWYNHNPNAKQNRSHYSDFTMGAMASQVTSLTIVYSTVYWGANQRKQQSFAFVRGIHRWPANFPNKRQVMRIFHLMTSSC